MRARDLLGTARFWMPNRFARVFAGDAQFGKPFLAPYDVLRFLPPRQAPILSRPENSEFSKCELERGWLLIVRSGRNLGPPAMVDSVLACYTLSDDMSRVGAPISDELFYFYGYMSSRFGSLVLRRDKSGSVIDHISPDVVADLEVPLIEPLFRHAVPRFRTAFQQRERARERLLTLISEFERITVPIQSADWLAGSRAFETSFSTLADAGRLDAEPRAPYYAGLRRAVFQGPNPCLLGDIATVYKPPGRYKTVYVHDEAHGRKMLSGRQMAQVHPVALRIMSSVAFENMAVYEIKQGMVLMTADGRAEENLADTVVVASDRDGWLASGHIHRLVPKEDIHRGLLYLVCVAGATQAQAKALARGSVVDALYEDDVRSLQVNAPVSKHATGLAEEVSECWTDLAEAANMEREGAACFDAELMPHVVANSTVSA